MLRFLTSILSIACCWSGLAAGIEILPPGHRPRSPGVHALVGATVVPKPGEVIENGTIIVRDGKIAAVGAGVEVPGEARRWEMKGTFIYAGLIDPYLTIKPRTPGSWAAGEDGLHQGGSHDVNFFGVSGEEKDPGNPGAGYGLVQITPERRVAEGYTNDVKNLELLRELGFTAGNVIPERGIMRGTGAFVLLQEENPTQSILKGDVGQHVVIDKQSARGDRYPNSLMGQIAVIRQALLDAQYYASGGRGDSGKMFSPALESLTAAASGKMRVFIEPGSVLMVDRLARIAKEFKLDFVFVASGQEWRRPELAGQSGATFIAGLNFPEVPKLPEEDDWEEVTLDLLRTWDWAPENAAVLVKEGRTVALTTYGLAERKNFRRNLRLALDRGLTEEQALAALTTIPAQIVGMDTMVGTIEAGKLANLTVVEGNYFVATNKVREVWIDGRVHRVVPAGKGDLVVKAPEETRDAEQAKAEAEEKKETETKLEKKRELLSDRTAKSPMEGRGPIASPKSLLIKNATIWTCGPEGVLEKADLLVQSGKVLKIGTGLEVPADTEVMDAGGKHITPGLIDCHSHSMVLGGVNEATLPSTAMVRIGDVINSETRRIEEELAGGLTIVNMLHGSANPIGGQNAVLKLRNGASPEELKMAGAPEGIKFALGENVKQSSRPGEGKRFPQTRLGVPAFMENRFTAARRYLREWAAFTENQSGREAPRRDLELEALGEILQGSRLIHCHSYRQDEILVFLRLMEKLGIKVATLQHVLEGYKVADEIAKHGAGASCFTDWWAYKFEVIDAIPYAGALMHERGVNVSFNSDSGDLSRRMYLEAAKAVKYGGLTEQEALKFVTINPARQLKIEKFVGSLEVGKDADFVLWSAPPLDSATVCLETWIDGKKYFDRSRVEGRATELRTERDALLAKARKVAGLAKPGQGGEKEKAAFFEAALEFLYENADRHCDSY